LPLFTSGTARILDSTRLINQFASLVRKTSALGRDQVNHPPGGRDDACNASSLAMVLAAEQKPPMRFAPPQLITKSSAGYDSNTGSIHRSPALAHGPAYGGGGGLDVPFWKFKP
jgi:hypothetical protein